MFNQSTNSKLYIITLDSKRINDKYMKKYFECIYQHCEYIKNKETGERECIPTKKLKFWDDELVFEADRSEAGRTIYSLSDKVCFCIAEFGYRYRGTTPYIDIINDTFKEIISLNKDKYNIEDVTEGLILPIDENWKRNTGENLCFVGYIDPGIRGVLTGWLKNNNITVEEFLKNPRYIMLIDSKFVNILDTLDYHGLISNKNKIYEV